MPSAQPTKQHELFCAHVADGMPAAHAAETCGFSSSYAPVLVKRFETRIAQLRALKSEHPLDQIASKSWIETQLVTIARACLNPPDLEKDEVVNGKVETLSVAQKPDYGQARLALMDLARLKGYVERPSAPESSIRNLSFNMLGSSEASKLLEQALHGLAPSQVARVKAIASGEIDIQASEVNSSEP